MRALVSTLAVAVVLLSTPLSAKPPGFAAAEKRGTVRPSPENYADYMAKRTGVFAAWYTEQQEKVLSYRYDKSLKFAECVSRFNSEAADKILEAPIGGQQDHAALARLAEANRGCVIELNWVHPLLLRAALAETRLRNSASDATGAVEPHSVGVPEIVDGYPVAAISRCQVQYAPELVSALLATRPGEETERAAAKELFANTPQCGASKLGRLTATAARLAVIDAVYRRGTMVPAR